MGQSSRQSQGQSVGFLAFTWGYPLVESLRTCRLQVRNDSASWHAGIDRLHINDCVSTDQDRDIVTPANDLLYTSGWINLADGPRYLKIPARSRHPGRYFVLALYDAWTNNFANPGFRESPAEGETVVLVGPSSPRDFVPEGNARIIHSPTNLVWLIGRVLAGDGDDVKPARALQAEIALTVPNGTDRGRLPAGVENWMGATEDTIAALMARPQSAAEIARQFFTNLCRGLSDQSVPASDRGVFDWLKRTGLIPESQFDFDLLHEELRSGLVQGLCEAVQWIEAASRSRRAKPWTLSFGLGRYGCEYLVRALTAYKGLGALAPEEALYAMCDFDGERQPLDGRTTYVQRFEPGNLPPVDGFWSVTLYGEDRFLYGNGIGRHSIGDRTSGLIKDPDGGLSLFIGHKAPADQRNWLPAPAGRFYLILRLYVPRAEVKSWAIPPLQALSHK